AFYVQSYLAFSLPAILAGFLAKSACYALTTDIYATAILLLMCVGLVSIRADRRRVAESAA
ncbi:MFS transporter, partial [Rhizobium brockwellii]